MNRLKMLKGKFNISDDEFIKSPFYELLCVYNSMVNSCNRIPGLERIKAESIMRLLPCDEYADASHLYEQILFDYDNSLIDQKELIDRFTLLFTVIKSIFDRENASYIKYISFADPKFDFKNISFVEFEVVNYGETYKEISSMLKKFSYQEMGEYALDQCKSSFLDLLDNTRGFINRETIDSNVKYTQLVYKFLKPEYVLDLKGTYLDIREVYIKDEVKNYMVEDLEYELLNKDIIHIDDIYENFKNTYPDEIRIYRIFTSYALFSLLEYLFRNIYEFKRPYITLKGKQIYNKNEMIEKFLVENSHISIMDFSDYLGRLKLSSAGFFNILDSMTNEICLENEDTLIHWDLIDISKTQIEKIEDLIYEEVSVEKTMAITDLQCAFYFPKLNIDWDEWFIYSLIKKHSNRLTVLPSSRQFRYSTPIVTVEKAIDEFELNYIDEYRNNKKIYKSTNLDIDEIELENIEDLLNMEV